MEVGQKQTCIWRGAIASAKLFTSEIIVAHQGGQRVQILDVYVIAAEDLGSWAVVPAEPVKFFTLQVSRVWREVCEFWTENTFVLEFRALSKFGESI